MSEVTRILVAIEKGDVRAVDELFPLVYQELRQLAAEAMVFLAEFEPRLVGPVLTGAVTISSFIELHLFTDAPEEVAMELDARRLQFRDCQKRYRYNGRGMSMIPGYRFSLEGERIEAIVFPEKGIRQPPLSPVDGKPMPRAGRARVLALLEGAA